MTMARWIYELDIKHVFRDREMSFEEKRDAIVKRIRNSLFHSPDDLVLEYILTALEEAADEAEFDHEWGWFYDYADEHRIWVRTF